MKSITVEFWQGTEKSSSTYTAATYEDAVQQANEGIFKSYYAQPNATILKAITEDMEAGEVNRAWSWFTITPTEATHPSMKAHS